MATVQMVEYEDAGAEVRALYDEIMAVRGIDFVPNVWKTLGVHPPTLRRVWRGLEQVMAPGRLDRLTKELIAIAVSATNACEYCVWSHTAAARKLGMDDEMLAEMMAVVGMFNQTNRLANGFQIEVDEVYRRVAPAAPAKRPKKAAAARAKGKRRTGKAKARRS
jgi:AhpD family alkylhydroperoxidase